MDKKQTTIFADRSNIEEKLRTAIHYLDNVLAKIPLGIAILEVPDFRYVRINNFLAEINNLPISAHIGKTISEILPEAAVNIIPRLQKVVDTGKTAEEFEFKTRLPKTAAQDRWFKDIFFPIRGLTGERLTGKIEAVGVMVEETTQVRESTLKFEKKIIELEKMMRAIADKELKMTDLKREVKEMEELGSKLK